MYARASRGFSPQARTLLIGIAVFAIGVALVAVLCHACLYPAAVDQSLLK